MKTTFKIILSGLCLLAVAGQIKAQDPQKPNTPPKHSPAAERAGKRLDSLFNSMLGRLKPGKIKPYETVVNGDFQTMRGLFTVHKNKNQDQWYFEIPDSLLGRDLLAVTRLAKVPGGAEIFAGEEEDSRAVKFVIGADSLMELQEVSTRMITNPGNQLAKAVANADKPQVLSSFAIVAYGRDKKSYVVDATKFLDGTPPSFINQAKGGLLGDKLGKVMGSAEDMRVVYAHAYPGNVDIRIRKLGDPAGSLKNLTAEKVTAETVTSFVALPKVPMMPRYFDSRVGYMPSGHVVFTDDQQASEEVVYTGRFRLEPKPEDMHSWKSGQLVEPKKPIIIYIDPATPKQWRPYLIAGINDWQQAFVKAGFKNAIIGKEWPEKDTSMHMDDARYSMINYFPSETENAYGPQTIDPRSGEVIQTHIGWYHNVMQLVRNWYITQAGALDPEARHARFSNELMGQLIRFVSSHEVGHTLGLRHNMLTSNFTPVDSLRSQSYLKKHGHTGSIMDYARFDYAAQPEDHIKQAQLWPHIGDYDRWAIEWGYGPVSATDPRDAKIELSKKTTERLKQNPALRWAESELNKEGGPLGTGGPLDPRAVSEVLGDNPMKANTLGIKNLQRATENIVDWAHVQDGDLHDLEAIYQEIQTEFTRFMGHVKNFITGVYYTPKADDEEGAVYAAVPKEMQLEALDFFDKQLFTTPTWLVNRRILEKINLPSSPNYVEKIQANIINALLASENISRLLDNETRFGESGLSARQYLETIHRSVWKELAQERPVDDLYRRNLQRAYVANLVKSLRSKEVMSAETEVSPILRADARLLQAQIKQALQNTKEQATLNYLRDLNERLDAVLNNDKGGATS